MTAYNGATTVGQNVQSDTSTAAPYQTAWAGTANIREDRLGALTYAAGYAVGYTAGQAAGYAAGYIAGEAAGSATGYATGYAAGQTAGYAAGYTAGYAAGFAAGVASVFIDSVSPLITIVSPPPGSSIGRATPLVFRITDETGIGRAMPAIKYTKTDNTYHYEIIHDGEGFTRDYMGTRTVIAGGFEYSVHRVGGWTSTIEHTGGNPELVPFTFDTSGNEPV